MYIQILSDVLNSFLYLVVVEFRTWIRAAGEKVGQDEFARKFVSIFLYSMYFDVDCTAVWTNVNSYLWVYRVRQSYPGEAGFVDQKEREIMDMWKDLQVSKIHIHFYTMQIIATVAPTKNPSVSIR